MQNVHQEVLQNPTEDGFSAIFTMDQPYDTLIIDDLVTFGSDSDKQQEPNIHQPLTGYEGVNTLTCGDRVISI